MTRPLVNIALGVRNIVRGLGATWQWATPLRGPQTVLITGASVGVGLATARILLDETEHRLVLTARPASMDRFAAAGIHEGPRVRLRALDVRDGSARKALVDAIDAEWGGVDVLINNAGVSYRSVVEQATQAERLDQFAVNFLAPMQLTQLVLPSMRRKRRGRILNVSSVGGMTAMPTMALYSASKFALEGASEALFYEVRPWGIRVTLVQPGFINSDGFLKVRFTEAGQRSLDDPADPYHRHYRNMEAFVQRLMTLTWSTSETVARTLVRTMHRDHPPLRVAGTLDAKLFALARRVVPRFVYHHLLYAGLPGVWSWGPRRRSADPAVDTGFADHPPPTDELAP